MLTDPPETKILDRNEALQLRELRRTRSALTRFHTVEQVAEAFGVSPRSVRRWIKSRDLAVHRFVPAAAIDDFIAALSD